MVFDTRHGICEIVTVRLLHFIFSHEKEYVLVLMKSIYIEIFEKKKSCFVGVKLRYGRWVAELSHKGKKYSAGSYDSELDAGRAINARCDSLGITNH